MFYNMKKIPQEKEDMEYGPPELYAALKSLEPGYCFDYPSKYYEPAKKMAKKLGMRVKHEDLGNGAHRIYKFNRSNSGFNDACLDALKRNWISRSELTRKTQNLNKQTRNSLLQSYIDNGLIETKYKDGKKYYKMC